MSLFDALSGYEEIEDEDEAEQAQLMKDSPPRLAVMLWQLSNAGVNNPLQYFAHCSQAERMGPLCVEHFFVYLIEPIQLPAPPRLMSALMYLWAFLNTALTEPEACHLFKVLSLLCFHLTLLLFSLLCF
jgi:hypothetical protein